MCFSGGPLIYCLLTPAVQQKNRSSLTQPNQDPKWIFQKWLYRHFCVCTYKPFYTNTITNISNIFLMNTNRHKGMIKIKIENILGHLENWIPYGIDIINCFLTTLCYSTKELPCQTNEVLGRIGTTNSNDIEFHRWYGLTVVQTNIEYSHSLRFSLHAWNRITYPFGFVISRSISSAYLHQNVCDTYMGS